MTNPRSACFLFALTFSLGSVACDDAPKAQTPPRQASVSANGESPAAKPGPTDAAPSAAAAKPSTPAQAPPAAGAEGQPPKAVEAAPEAGAGGDVSPPTEAAPEGKADPSTPAPSDGRKEPSKTSERAGKGGTREAAAAAPREGRRVEHFTECGRSETFADGRCYSSHQAACEALGCKGECSQLKSMPPQAACR